MTQPASISRPAPASPGNDPLAWVTRSSPVTSAVSLATDLPARTSPEPLERISTVTSAAPPEARPVAARPAWETAATVLDLLGSPVMVADGGMVIRYANPACSRMFETIEGDPKADEPGFRARDVVGRNFESLHLTPSLLQGLAEQPAVPQEGQITAGGQVLTLILTPHVDSAGAVDCVTVEFKDSRAMAETLRQDAVLVDDLQAMMAAHASGDASHVLDASKHRPALATIARAVNGMVAAPVAAHQNLLACITQFAAGNFDASLTRNVGAASPIGDALEAVRANMMAFISEIERLSTALLEGNLDEPVTPENFRGAFRSVIETVDRAFAGLNGAFRLIGGQVNEVATAVTEMSASARSLAANAQIQSASVDEVSASAEETDSQVKANAAGARSANLLAAGASVVAADGKDKIAEMVSAMDGIRVSSQGIAKIIKVIDEIAFQTNLLALNAAVEAARAGQHGRGFAVVAHEVRNLAGRSAKAARETSDLIEDAGTRVQAGVQIATEASKSFVSLAGDINKVTTLVSEISKSSDEQSRGVAQINIAIGEVAKTALSTSQQAEQLAAVVAQMLASTDVMAAEVGRFRLRKAAPKAAVPSLDQLPPEVLLQLQQMVAAQMGLAKAPLPVPAPAPGRVSRTSDRDDRGFSNF